MMKHSKLLYGFLTILGIVFLVLLFSTIFQGITHGTMTTNGLTVTKAEFRTVSGNNSVITISIENNGDFSFVFRVAKVNDDYFELTGTNVTVEKGASCTVEIILTSGNYWVAGNDYKMGLYDSNDIDRHILASYQATATPTIESTPSPESEPFPITLAVVSIAIVALIGLGILAYFKKNKKE